MLVRKQLDHSEDNVASLEKRTKDTVAQLDMTRSQYALLSQEKDTIQNSLEALKSEKSNLDRTRLDLNAAIESLNHDYDRLQKNSNKLQKDHDALHAEKLFLQSEVERLNQEADLREINLRGEEDRCSRMREELLTVREELNKLYLSYDMLEAQKVEADNVISNLEKTKGKSILRNKFSKEACIIKRIASKFHSHRILSSDYSLTLHKRCLNFKRFYVSCI